MGVEVLQDESDKKREELRDRMRRGQIDRTALSNPEPGFRYRFTNSKPRAVRHATAGQGFETVKHDDPCKPIYGEWDEALGAYRLGEDLILTKEPIDLFEDKRTIAREKMDRAAAQVVEEARDNINRLNRNEARGPAHTDITFDESRQGPDEVRIKPKKREG